MKTTKLSKLLGVVTGVAGITAGTLMGQQPPEERFSVMLGGSMTGAGDVELSGDTLGEVETTRAKVEASYSIPAGEEWSFEIGGTYERLDTDFTRDITLIPEDLTAISLKLAVLWRINDQWALNASVSPGFYGDSEVEFSDGLNAPLMLLALWQKSENLSVAAGLRVDAFSDLPVLPVLGVNWKINPEWELGLGVPRTELRYQRNERLALYGGFAMEGNSYAVDNPSLVTPSGVPVGDTYVSESEFRVLLGVEYTLDSGVKLTVEGGYGFGREFDYHDEDVKLEVDPGAFGAISVSYAF